MRGGTRIAIMGVAYENGYMRTECERRPTKGVAAALWRLIEQRTKKKQKKNGNRKKLAQMIPINKSHYTRRISFSRWCYVIWLSIDQKYKSEKKGTTGAGAEPIRVLPAIPSLLLLLLFFWMVCLLFLLAFCWQLKMKSKKISYMKHNFAVIFVYLQLVGSKMEAEELLSLM